MATATMRPPAIYGLMAEFDDPTSLVAAAKRTYAAGYRKIDTFSPYPIEEAWEAIGQHDRRLSLIVLGGGLTGLLTGLGLQEWVHQIAYPINIAGKPLNSWPQFVPVIFELANERFQPERALTVDEAKRYYRRDMRVWGMLQTTRRLDRAWQQRVRRRPYRFLLPGRINRRL